LRLTADDRLSNYVSGLVAEARAEAAAIHPLDPVRQKEAQELFLDARSHYRAALAAHDTSSPIAVSSSGRLANILLASTAQTLAPELFAGDEIENTVDASPSHIVMDVNRRLVELSSAKPFQDVATELAKTDELNSAFETLREGTLRHPDSALWTRMIEMGIRARRPAGELTDLIDSATNVNAIFDPASFQSPLLRAMLSIRQVQRELAETDLILIGKVTLTANEVKASTARSKRMSRQLDSAVQLLQEAEKRLADGAGGADPVQRARCQAFRSLAIALSVDLQATEALPSRASLVSTYTTACAASRLLKKRWMAEPDNVVIGEALVAALQGRGFLAIAVEDADTFTAESMNAFAAAVDVQSRLPFGFKDTRLLGSPVVRTIRRRPENILIKVVEQERHDRATMRYLVDGVIALHSGDINTAVRQFESGRKLAGPGVGRSVGLARPLYLADSLSALYRESDESIGDVREMLDVYRILAATERTAKDRQSSDLMLPVVTSDPRRDPLTLARILLQDRPGPSGQNPQDDNSWLVSRIGTPLGGFVVIRAIEERMLTLESMNPERDSLHSIADAAVRRTLELIEAESSGTGLMIAARVSNASRRMIDDTYYRERALELSHDLRLSDAAVVLQDGLAHHPTKAELWKLLLQNQMKIATLAGPVGGPDQIAALRRVQQLGDLWESTTSNGKTDRILIEGQAKLALGQTDEARQAFFSVLASTSRNRIRVESLAGLALSRVKSQIAP